MVASFAGTDLIVAISLDTVTWTELSTTYNMGSGAATSIFSWQDNWYFAHENLGAGDKGTYFTICYSDATLDNWSNLVNVPGAAGGLYTWCPRPFVDPADGTLSFLFGSAAVDAGGNVPSIQPQIVAAPASVADWGNPANWPASQALSFDMTGGGQVYGFAAGTLPWYIADDCIKAVADQTCDNGYAYYLFTAVYPGTSTDAGTIFLQRWKSTSTRFGPYKPLGDIHTGTANIEGPWVVSVGGVDELYCMGWGNGGPKRITAVTGTIYDQTPNLSAPTNIAGLGIGGVPTPLVGTGNMIARGDAYFPSGATVPAITQPAVTWTNAALLGGYAAGAGASGTATVAVAAVGVKKVAASLAAGDVTGNLPAIVNAYASGQAPDNADIASILAIVNSGSYGNAALQTLLNTLVTVAGNLSNLMALENIQGPAQIVTPEAGTTPYQYVMVLKGANNAVADPDNNTTVSVTVHDGSGNLIGSAAATWTTAGGLGTVTYAGKLSALVHTRTGWFGFTYTADYNDASPLSLQMVGQATIAAVSRNPVLGVGVFDANTITAVASMLGILQKIAFGSGSGPTYPIMAVDASGNALATHADVAAIPTNPLLTGDTRLPATLIAAKADIPAPPSDYLSSTEQTQLAAAAGLTIPTPPTAAAIAGATAAAILKVPDVPLANDANGALPANNLPADYLNVPEQAQLAKAGSLVIAPVVGATPAKVQDVELSDAALYGAYATVITVIDQLANPVTLSGKTLEMQFSQTCLPTVVAFVLQTGGPAGNCLAVDAGGTNQLDVAIAPANFGTPGLLRWILWDVTTTAAPVRLLEGTLLVGTNPQP